MKKKALSIGFMGIFLLFQPIRAQTWTASKRLTWTSDKSSAPAISVDSSNHLHIVWCEQIPGNPEIYYKKSTDEGTSWNTAKRLTWTSGASYSPAIAVDSTDNIHMVWYDHTPGNPEIFYKRSTNGGVNWGDTKRLTWTTSHSFSPKIAVDSSNNIHVVWFDSTSSTHEIFYKRSTNGGVNWGNVKRLSWTSGHSSSPAIAVNSGNNLYVMWHDESPGNPEIYYKKSTNSGVNWGDGKRLTWNSGSSYSPSLTVDASNNIHVVWHDWTPNNPEIYYKRSTNGGMSWTTKRLTWTSGYSFNPVISTDTSNNIHVVWHDETPGIPELYYKRSINGGVSWTTKRLTWNSGYSYSPTISTDSNNRIYVIWIDNTPGNYEIFYRKGIQ